MPKTVLLLDDDRSFRRTIVAVLERRGFRVVEAGNGMDAARIVGEEEIDLAIVDGLLPDTDGIKWITKLRETHAKTPVVFVSAFWRDLETFRLLTGTLGVALVVHKPVVPADFAEQIALTLHASDTEESLTTTAEARAATESLLAELQAAYKRELPARIDELTTAVRRALELPLDRTRAAEARQHAHNLKGSGATHGMPALSTAAARLEDALEALPEGASAKHTAEVNAALREVLLVARALGDDARSVPPAAPPPRMIVLTTDAQLSSVVDAARLDGIELVRVATPDEAASSAREPDVLAAIVDVGELDVAVRLARELRALPGHDKMPLAFVSAAETLAERVAAVHAGASLVLVKPLDPVTLAEAARRLAAADDASRARVLIVDDDKKYADGIAAMLRAAGMWAATSESSTTLLDTLAETRPDLVLLDVEMPTIGGYDACRALRATPRWQDLPILFLTGRADSTSRLRAFQAGGDDYLVKPILKEELLARIRVRLERARLGRERADRDAVTGVSLRRPFAESFFMRLREAERKKKKLSVCLVDVDDLRAVNESHGWLAGDRVLAGLGHLLTIRLRTEDLRCRWAGEEFVLALYDEEPRVVENVVTRLLVEFSAIAFTSDAGEIFHASFSAGVASYPDDGVSLEALLRVAASRLDETRRAGRNRVSVRSLAAVKPRGA